MKLKKLIVHVFISHIPSKIVRYPQEPLFVVPNCLEEMVKCQHFGRKTGKGFYQWYGEKRGEPVC
jgi:3-hydroxyacyl-CoA dehydrogenase